MIRAARALLRLALASLVLVAVALAAAWLFLTRSEYSRDWIAAAATRLVEAPVAIGALGVDWDEGLVLSASGVRIVASDGGDDALQVEGLRIRLHSPALARMRFEPREIELDAPRLRLLTGIDGRLRLAGTDRRLGGRVLPDLDRLFERLAAGMRIEVNGGELHWRGEGAGEALEASAVEVRGEVRDGSGDLSARAALAGGGGLAVDLRLDGAGAVWRASLDGLPVAEFARRLPFAMDDQRRLPMAGSLSARVEGSWQRARGSRADVRLHWLTPAITARGRTGTVAADALRASATLHGGIDGWQGRVHDIEFRHGALVWTSPPWSLRGSGAAARAVLEQGTEAAAVRTLLAVLMPAAPVTEYLLATAPTGWIDSAEAGADGTGVWLELDAVGVQSRPSEWIPGAERGAGRLRLEPDRGSWTMNAPHAGLVLPRLFRESLDLGALSGTVYWRRVSDGWRVYTDEVSLRSARGNVDARLELDVPREDPAWPQMRLAGTFEGIDAAAVPDFLPVGKLPPDAVRWLDRAIVGGRAERGSFVVEGPARRFPFPGGEGRFDVDAELSDVQLDYAPDWPQLARAEGRLQVRRTALDATVDRGELDALQVEDVTIRIPDLDTPEAVVEIDGSGHGPLADIVRFLAEGPLPFGDGLRAVGMSGAGGGELRLDLRLPLRAPDSLEIDGRFDFDDGRIRFASGIELEALEGGFDFTEGSLSGGPVDGRMLGGPVRIDVETPRPGRKPLVRFRGQGRLDTARLDPWTGSMLAGAFEGRTDWQGRLEVEAERAELEVATDLVGARSHLPVPLSKEPDMPWPGTARFAYGEERTRLDIAIDGRAHVAVDLGRAGDTRIPERIGVQVGNGRASLPPVEGVEVRADVDSIDADGWWDRWRAAEEAVEAGDADELPLLLLEARARETRWLGRELGAQHFHLERASPGRWQARIDGDAIEGGFELAIGDHDRLDLDLDRVYLPARAGEAESDDDSMIDPSTLPYLVARVGDLVWDEWHLGAMRVEGGPVDGGWRAHSILLRRPELDGRGELRWTREDGRARTSARFDLATRDLGDTLEALGLGRQVNGGLAALEMEMSWDASPPGFSLAALDATYRVEASDGQVLSVNPGVGRLVGLFNAEAIFRRLTLDFKDVFGRGLAFDRVDSVGYIAGGRLHFTDHHLVGPAALIGFTGHSDLVARRYDIEMTVAPTYGGNLSTLVGGLASPAVGAAVYLAQRMFQRQIRQLVRSRYRVTGSWDDPLVVPLGRLPAEANGVGERTRAPDVQTRGP